MNKESIIQQKTKTYKYLFIPMLTIFFKEEWISNSKKATSRLYTLLNELDIDNVYLGETEKDIEKQLFHVIINSKDHAKTLDILKRLSKDNAMIAGSYPIGTTTDMKYVLLVNMADKESGAKFLKYFMKSKYSKIYDKVLLEHEAIANRFNNEELRNIYKVLTRDGELLATIADNLGIDYEDVKELDSKIDLENELFKDKY